MICHLLYYSNYCNIFRGSIELQAEMFDRMCSVRSSEMILDEPEYKNSNDESQNLESFNTQLWKDPDLGSSKRDYDIGIFHNTYDTSDDLVSKE